MDFTKEQRLTYQQAPVTGGEALSSGAIEAVDFSPGVTEAMGAMETAPTVEALGAARLDAVSAVTSGTSQSLSVLGGNVAGGVLTGGAIVAAGALIIGAAKYFAKKVKEIV